VHRDNGGMLAIVLALAAVCVALIAAGGAG
jgi:hypothetical protein